MLKRAVIACACLVFGLSLSAHAADAKDLSGKTSWVMTADLKAANASPLMKFISEQIAPDKRKQAEAKLASVQAMFGVDLLNDIEYIVLAGAGRAEQGGVAYAYGKFDQQRLTTILAGADQYSSVQHEGVAVQGWYDKDDGKQKFISFARPGLVLLADRQDVVKEALDVLGGRKAGLPPDSPLAKAFQRTPENIISIYASGVSSIVGEEPKAAILKQAEGMALRIRASGEEALNADLSVTTDTVETAQQIQQALLGVQALTLLNAAESPETAALAGQAKITMDGKAVGVTLNLPKSLIEKILSSYQTRENQ